MPLLTHIRPLFIALALLGVLACAGWDPVPTPTPQPVATQPPTVMPQPNSPVVFAECLDQMGVSLNEIVGGYAAAAVAAWRCRHLEPEPPAHWSPRCTKEAREAWKEQFDYDGNLADWYAAVVCTPAFRATP